MAAGALTPEELAELNGTAAPAPGGFTPEELAELNGPPPAAPAPPLTPEPTTGEALRRGATQGATLEWGDELKGLASALFDRRGRGFTETYRSARDEARARNREVAAAHPVAYGAANLAGSVVLPAGKGVKSRSVTEAAKSAAKMSAVAGAGGSEAETVEGVATDAGVSAVVGGVTGGLLNRLIRGAPERQVKRLVGDVTDGVPKTVRDRVVGKRGANVDDVAQEIQARPDFAQAARTNSAQAFSKADAIRSEIGEEIAGVYDQIDKSGALGVPKNEIRQAVGSIIKSMEGDPATKPVREMLRRELRNIDAEWEGRHVPLGQVRRYITSIQNKGFAGNILQPNAQKELQRDIAGAVKGVLDKRFDEITQTAKNLKAAPSVASRPGFAPLTRLDDPASKIGDLNKRYSTWKNITKSLDEKSTREATESTRLKDRIGGGIDMGLALVDPATFVAKKGYDFVGKPALRAMDDKLAALVTAAERGSTVAELTARALELGAGPTVARALATWAQQQMGGVE